MNEHEDVDPVRVTKLERHDDGYWTANASINGSTRTFHNRHGTWLTDRRARADHDWPKGVRWREAHPRVAQALQRKLRRAERRERVVA